MIKLIKKHVQHVSALVRHTLNDAVHAHQRSSQWPHVKNDFLEDHPCCAACGGKKHLNVHHKRPFHLDKSMELDKANLITLCMGIGEHCHLLIGHGDDFKAYNPNVAADAVKALLAHEQHDEKKVSEIVATAKEERLFVLAG